METVIAGALVACAILGAAWMQTRARAEGLAHLLSHRAHTPGEVPEPVIPLEHSLSNAD